MKNRNKGFTLVEIIISIAIGSIVLALMGTMILTSSNFMSNTTNSDMDKRCVDSCMEFIRDQIEYSTDVRIIENKGLDNYPVEGEDNWHYIYIKDDVLYRDGSPVFDDSFYNHKQLEILVKDDYKNNMRVDFTYHLNDSDGEKAYGNRDTIVFLNITEKVNNEQGLYVSENVSLDANKSFSEKGNYAVYYKKSLTTNNSSDKPSDNTEGNDNYVYTGTVIDQKALITPINEKGIYDNVHTYKKGEYVYSDGYWWVWLGNYDVKECKPGTITSSNAHRWKKLDKFWDPNSGYIKGDIIIHNSKYYECQSDYQVDKFEAYVPGTTYGDSNQNFWKELVNYSATTSNIIETSYTDTDKDKKPKCVSNKLGLDGLSWENKLKKLNKIPTYDENISYKIGDIVKIEVEHSGVYQYYLKLFNNLGRPGKRVLNVNTKFEEVGWQHLSTYYDENSAYVKGDIIYGSKVNFESYYKVSQNAGLFFQPYHTLLNIENAGNINVYVPFNLSVNNTDNFNGMIIRYDHRWFENY